MKSANLFSPYKLGRTELKNRIVMAPMTRSRAVGNVPNKIMEEYYVQRADAGLIITEGTSPSPNDFGYCHIPGIYNEEQVVGWKNITDAVHAKDGKIFLQLIHIGRISRHAKLPDDAVICSASAVRLTGQMWEDTTKLKDFPVPTDVIIEEIKYTKQEYIQAAVKAIKAGFDGVELHCDNDYMLEQYLSTIGCISRDNSDGSIENNCNFLLEVTKGIIDVIGNDKVGLCISPYGVSNDLPNYSEIVDTYEYLAEKLNSMGILYIHLLDHISTGAPALPLEIKKVIRKEFENTLIFSGGYTKERAENELESGFANLIAFGRPFINNPDLVSRFNNGWQLSKYLDTSTFYSHGEKGYTDYPIYTQLSN
jgi:N-ethylmaleimide reductase